MTDWATAPPGAEMDAAVAERVMNLEPCDEWSPVLHPVSGYLKNCDHAACYPRGYPAKYSENVNAAFQVMAARDGWRWTVADFDDCVHFRLANELPFFVFNVVVRHDEPGIDGDRRKAFCLGVCRCALMAVEGESNADS